MTRIIRRQSPQVSQMDHHERIRILERVPHLGQGCEFQLVPGDKLGTSDYVDLSGAYNIIDPLGYFDAGDPTKIVIPDGLAGIYSVSIKFKVTAE